MLSYGVTGATAAARDLADAQPLVPEFMKHEQFLQYYHVDCLLYTADQNSLPCYKAIFSVVSPEGETTETPQSGHFSMSTFG